MARRAPHLSGAPCLPKALLPDAPYSRAAYNSFVVWIQQLGLSSVATVVDVGANHGDFSRAASLLFPSAKVLLVEPLPKLQQLLQGVIEKRRPNWRLIPCALGSQPGRFPLFVDENRDDIGSLVGFSDEYRAVRPEARASREILCDVKTLDAVSTEFGLHGIDLLKIDVEGFEFEVLNGASEILRKTTAVIVEVSLVRRSDAQNALLEMLERLVRGGFEVVNVIPSLFDQREPWRPREFNVLVRRTGPFQGAGNPG